MPTAFVSFCFLFFSGVIESSSLAEVSVVSSRNFCFLFFSRVIESDVHESNFDSMLLSSLQQS